MKLLAVHPSGLMYNRIFLRLEPLGLELIAQAVRRAGHEVRLIDLQAESPAPYLRVLDRWQPDAVCFCGNYLANVPEIIDLACEAKTRVKGVFVFVGGHSASFIASDMLAHGEGAVDCVLTGEGEGAVGTLLEAIGGDLTQVPGAVTPLGAGPTPRLVDSLDDIRPARDLLHHRRRYFIGTLDPCASIEFARGCPWDCTFCSAWTFYGRSYRMASPALLAEELASLAEPGVFIVDDVAFVHQEHGMAIAEEILRRGVRKRYYLETRGDVLLRNKEVFRLWRRLGLEYMFLGLEAIDEAGLELYRKRTHLDVNFEALEFARSLGIIVAINIIADPSWDRERFAAIRAWCLEIPEVVNISVNTPYPGTETWLSEQRRLTTRDYRLFDIQHAVLPTKLPLAEFYEELVKTQRVLNQKHLGWAAAKGAASILVARLARGQTNFARMIWKFNSVYDPALQMADHARAAKYLMTPPPPAQAGGIDPRTLYIHASAKPRRSLDAETRTFVNQTANSPVEGGLSES
jgi:hopanoid C-3 methylase HpnR